MKTIKHHKANYPEDICKFLNDNKVDPSNIISCSITIDNKQVVYYWEVSKIYKDGEM